MFEYLEYINMNLYKLLKRMSIYINVEILNYKLPDADNNGDSCFNKN